jgi:hypothetical protein
MITTHKSNLEERCEQRRYTLDQVSACVVSKQGDVWTIDETHPDYPHPKGVGTVLKEQLKWFRIAPTNGCWCDDRAKTMDENGPDWCKENIDTISSWLQEGAKAMRLPYVQAVGRILINKAIKDYEAIEMSVRQRSPT